MRRLERGDGWMEASRRPEGASRLTAVLFDLGNTLVGGSDTEEAFMSSVRSLVKLLEDRGYRVEERRVAEVRLRNREYFKEVRRATLREVLGEVWMAKDLEGLGVEPSRELVAEALKAHCEAILSHRFVYDDALVALEELRDAGAVMAVVSNVSVHDLAVESLKRLGLLGYFKAVVTSAQVGWRKPHPAIFAEALRRLDCAPSEAVFVGDDPVADVEGAKGVGMKAVLVERRGAKPCRRAQPDLRLTSLRELCSALEAL